MNSVVERKLQALGSKDESKTPRYPESIAKLPQRGLYKSLEHLGIDTDVYYPNLRYLTVSFDPFTMYLFNVFATMVYILLRAQNEKSKARRQESYSFPYPGTDFRKAGMADLAK